MHRSLHTGLAFLAVLTACTDALFTTGPTLLTPLKGYVKPGPFPDPIAVQRLTVEENETLDAISGHWRIFQSKRGHRYSTDDVLVAWYGTSWCPTAARVLELGSGIGSVGFVAAWRLRGAQFVTVEAQEESLRLAQKSAAYNGITGRFDQRLGDFRYLKEQGGPLGGDEADFELILGSPPYFPTSEGTLSTNPQKAACRYELRGNVADYCATAVRHLAPGGVLSLVFPVRPPRQLERVEAAAKANGLVIVRRRAVRFKESEEPLLGLFLLHRAADLPVPPLETWVEPDLVIRRDDGSDHPEYTAVRLSFGFHPHDAR